MSVPPPRLVTAFHSKTTDPFPTVPVRPVGVAGSPYGVEVTELPEPSPSDDDVAFTEKVYGVPLVSPVNVHDKAADGFDATSTTQSLSPEEETVYESGVPPDVGADHVTVTVPSPDVAVGLTTTPGGVDRPRVRPAIHVAEPEVRVAGTAHVV